MYVPMISNINNRGAIGVAVADSPYGPFYDPLGKPLVQSEWGDIDPTVFIDDDGQAYLYWGNPNLYYVCLLYTSPSPRDRTRSRMPSSA